MLRLIGYWKGSLRDEYPFPQELTAKYVSGGADKLAEYLESGALFARHRGHSWCRFGCSEPNGSAELTDGKWVWPEGLAHYLRRHPIALPSEFVRDATATDRSGRVSRSLPVPKPGVDRSYWTNWARSYRVPAVEMLLDEARAAAAHACEAMLDDAANRHTARGGLGTTSCITAACGRQVVAGKVFCGRCLAERDRDRLQLDADFTELRRVLALLPRALPPNKPLQRTRPADAG